MKKIHMIAALLAMLPTMLFAGSTTYYAKLTVAATPTAGGKVYASTSETKPGTSTSASDNGESQSYTFWAHAQANEGYRFTGWTGDKVSTNNPCPITIEATSTTKNKPTTKNMTAKFEQLPPATVTFTAPVNGNYTVNGEPVTAQLVNSNQPVPYSVTLAATPAANFKFGGWYTEKNGEKTIFSTELTTTKKFNEDTTVGALFIPDGFAIYAAVAGKGYNSLSEALSEAESGEAITIFDNVTLQDSALIRVGVTLTVSSGVTLTVNGTLTVAGKLVNEGTVNGSGTLRKISYLIDQNEQNLQILHAPDGSEYGEITETHHDGIKPRYYKTKVTIWTPSVSGTINTATQAWGILLNGENVYAINAQSVKGVSVTLNTTIAVNKIASITGSLTSIEIQKGDTSSSKNWVVFEDCSLKGPAHTSDSNRLNFQGTIDLCGNTLTFGLGRTYSDFAPLILNGKVSFTPGTDFQNAAGVFFNCSSVKITNIKGECYFHFYDCGSEDSLADLVFGYQSSSYRYAYVYGGYYKFGIETSSWFSSSTTYGFNSDQDQNYVKIYGGSFLDDPSDYRENKNTLVVLNPNSENNSSEYYLVTSLTSPAQKVAKINDKEYASLQTAINEANANETIVLINPCDFESTTIQIPQEKSIILSLDGYALSGSKIVNNGALTITDSTTGVGLSNTDVSSGIVSCGIENYGTLDLVFGSYSGAIVNKSGGTLTTHNGLFTGTLTKDAGTVNLRGGHFTADVTALATLPNSKVFHMNNLYTVCEVPNGTMYDTTVKGMAGYGATPYPVTDDHTLLKTRYVSNKSGRSDYSANNWKRLAELMAFYQLFNNHGLDPTLVFDRYVVKDSVNLAAASGSSEQYSELYLDVPAGTPYRALTEKLIRGTNPATGKPWASKTYKAILEEDLTSVAVAVTDKDASGNAGTLCKAMIELWESERAQDYSSTGHKITNTVHVAGQKLFTLGAGSNKAMIRPATGAATFYATLGAAMDAAADGGTVMLANDCTTALPLTKPGTYTFDTMGFAHSDEVLLGEGLVLKSVDVDSSAKVLVADAVAKKYVVARKIDFPPAVSGLVYDGTVKTGVVAAGTGYTLSGNTATAAGSYTATATLGPNYVWSDGSSDAKEISWSIGKATITVTADAKAQVYGGEAIALTYTAGDLAAGNSFSGALTREAGDTVGSYAITQGTLSAGDNYTIEFTGANYVITAAKATIPMAVSGLVYDGTEKTGVTAGMGYTLSGNTATAAGSHSATATLAANYVWSDDSTGAKTITWSIAAKPATITVASASKVYGESDPAFTGTVEGLVNANDLGTVTYVRTGADSSVGTYNDVLTANYTPNSNYVVTVVPATFTITRKGVTVTVADDYAKTYGEDDPIFEATVEGLTGSDTIEYAISRKEGENVGEYVVTPAGEAVQGNYSVNYVPGKLTINTATLTATAENKTVVRGETVEYTIAYSGFVNGDSATSITAPTASCAYDPTDHASSVTSYPITLSGGAADNYSISRVDGTLTVDPCVATAAPDGSTTHYFKSLADAVAAANGSVVTLVAATDETITLTAEGQTFRLTVADGVSFNDAQITTSAPGCVVSKTMSATVATYTVTKSGPPDPVEKVEYDGVPATAEQQAALREEDENGNPKWENVVMGQNGATPPAIETSTNGTATVADMVLSFKAPAKTGYTVKYAFDKVDSAGSVLASGTVQENPQLDLTQVTTAGEPAYFKMRAVLESNDHSITTNVPVEHTVGVLKVESSATYTIIAVPWKSFHDTDVNVSELVHAASLSEDDMLYAYDGEGNLKSWRVSKDGVWVQMKEQQEDGTQVVTPDPAGFGIARGKGAWLKRSNTTKPIYLMGMPPASTDAATTALAAPASGETSWNLLASPKLEAVNFGKFNTGDEIIVPTAGTPKHYTYKNNAWGYPGVTVTEEKKLPNGQTIKVIKTEHKTGDTTVAPGTGFWYLNKGGAKTIEW